MTSKTRRVPEVIALCGIVAGSLLAAAGPAQAIAGGEKVPDEKAPPWLVSITSKGEGPLNERLTCGGSLISPTRVLTAAHCLDNGNPNNWEVRVGGSTLSKDPGQKVGIEGFATHPDFRVIYPEDAPDDFLHAAGANDIAVIELTEPLTDVPHLDIARETPDAKTPVTLFGRGLTGPPAKENLGDAVRSGQMRVIGDQQCRNELGEVIDPASVICAKSPTAMACGGDSGGPLIQATRLGPRVVGVSSVAGGLVDKECGDGYANGFADATLVRDWLKTPNLPLAPMPLAKPTMSGEKKAGNTLTCDLPEWGTKPSTVEYTWMRSQDDGDGFEYFVPAKGENGKTLEVTKELAEGKVFCSVDAAGDGGRIRMYADAV